MSLLNKSIEKHFIKILKKKINYFDVSLRDGLQSQKKIYSFDKKKILLMHIINKYNPKDIEIGSLVNPKILPQMNDSLELYKFAESLKLDNNFYLLIPNKKKLKIVEEEKVKNVSLISSFSNNFQIKNINKTLNETKKEIVEMNTILNSYNWIENKKLYLSCFNDCPIIKKIDENKIYDEILFYKKYTDFNNYCLSDTTGNLTLEDYKRLIDKINIMINPEKLSIHLHYNNKIKEKTKDIIKYSLKNNINKIDISCIDEGGCVMTLGKDNLNQNMSYDLFEEI
jgi:isopropylmalate/homocitrate/citramalate synthase